MGKHVITRYINISTLISRHKFKTICPKAVRGEAQPHKDNLIGSAAGGVLRSVCLKLVTSSEIALSSSSFIIALQRARRLRLYLVELVTALTSQAEVTIENNYSKPHLQQAAQTVSAL